jgi:DNA primase
VNQQAIDFFERLLGPSKKFSHNEHYFFCPKCGHHKKKLAVNFETGHWKCWICENTNQMKGKSLFSLLKKLDGTKEQVNHLKGLIGVNYDLSYVERLKDENKNSSKVTIELPKEFISFKDASNTPDFKNALRYLKKRGISTYDIIKYNIGYCDTGYYNGYIIMPSYDENGNLNYFVTRSFYDSPVKHKNPNFSKDIIFNDIHICWSEDITICEGAFDAYAIRRNAIPILGKYIQPELQKKIYQKRVKRINICLDNDAKKESMAIIEKLLKDGIEVRFADLQEKDPSEIGFAKMTEYVKNALPIDFTDLIKFKLG